ncbi:O-linked N-acetylglucosamine transferase family protein [Methylobacterium sp. SyP6R]|uniref:O-linked N-acetylglucosamine transferase family protein n=1 Tax=Methylobacterium sp. SyP6R TaxID=2718876 RepID=UPI001F2689F0|nr:tetratricopeptide repeat protein [Methylobacterium sp. SyP6R]MCF4129637.1 tetratricopeptide repeat protein [Methylobacterium sp. SyP6R]
MDAIGGTVGRLVSEGIDHLGAGRGDAGIANLRAALAVAPGHPDALLVLGLAAAGAGRTGEAVEALTAVLARDPEQPDALYHLAAALARIPRAPEAVALLRRLLRLRTDYPGAAFRLGTLLAAGDEPVAAEAALRLALIDAPGMAGAANNLGAALMARRRLGAAETWYRRAVAADPADPHHRKNLGICLLTAGRLEEGLRHYEARLLQPVWRWRPDLGSAPPWRGEPLVGRTILVHYEQGLGDSVQFVRYLPLLKAMGARTVFLCQAPLRGLLASAPGIDRLVAEGEDLPPFDCHQSLMSLPHLCGTRREAVPAVMPYLAPEPARVAAWARRLPSRGLRIGIHWRASGALRAIPLAAFAPLAALPGVSLHSLQRVEGLDELAEHGARLGIARAEADPDDAVDGFADVAALAANLDLIVCCDSSVAHVAGALGRPVFLVLPWMGDWRWMDEPERTPWYPGHRLFRCSRPGDWAGAMARVAEAVAALVRDGAGEGGPRGATTGPPPVRDMSRPIVPRPIVPRPIVPRPIVPRPIVPRPIVPRLLETAFEAYLDGRLDRAGALARDALAAAPEHAEIRLLLGLVAAAAGRPEPAAAWFRDALCLDPRIADAWINLGQLSCERGDEGQGLRRLDRAVTLDPEHGEAWLVRGSARLTVGEKAAADLDRAVTLQPADVRARILHGAALRAEGRAAAAGRVHEAAVAWEPDSVEAWHELGHTRRGAGDGAGAARAYRRAARLDPDRGDILSAGLFTGRGAGDWDAAADAAITARLRAVAAADGIVLPLANLLIDDDPARQLRSARTFRRKTLGPVAPWAPPDRPEDPERPLTVGYVSADFHEHATAYLAAEVFELHDRAGFRTIGYATRPDDGGPMRRRLRAAFDRFHEVADLPDAALAERIRADGIDILVDLKGPTEQGRHRLWRRRLAPLQVHWLGYPGTLGGAAIDYLIGDPVVTPPEHQAFFDEHLVLLPETYQPNDRRRPRAAAPAERRALGLEEDAFVFAAMNAPHKVAPTLFSRWMRLLDRRPGAQLWIYAPDAACFARMRSRAAGSGIAPERLIWAAPLPQAGHLARIGAADLCLDSFPYTGHTTTSDALWAGVPVVTCLGEGFAARVAGSLLRAAGLPELVTASPDAYEDLAVRLAAEPERLAGLRRRLAEGRETCPLFDTPRFVRHLESAWRRMWRRQAAGLPPAPFRVEPAA